MADLRKDGGIQTFTSIKTDKSVVGFRKALNRNILRYKNPEIETLISSMLQAESISPDSLLMLFWNASYNNDLLDYLNRMVFFPALYSGRISVRQDEVIACMKDLKPSETVIQNWSESTLRITSSKYLTFLKKLNLMEGSQNKTILHPYLDDKMWILFLYWLSAVENKVNVLESKWLQYSFNERQIFIERILQKKYLKFIHISFSGDSLKIEPIMSYKKIYHALIQS